MKEPSLARNRLLYIQPGSIGCFALFGTRNAGLGSEKKRPSRAPRALAALAVVFGLLVASEPSSSDHSEIDSSAMQRLEKLNLEELLQAKIAPPPSLTRTAKRLIPAAVTTITREQIDRSAARSLDELLEIYVPGLQIMFKDTGGHPLGFRGIISDRNNKFLILVHGRIMNERTTSGAIPERFLSMLGDIEQIEVVRGPGSAIYGPGAIAGVVSITTYNGLSFEGTDVKVRQGFIEQFSSFEMRHGTKMSENSGLFVYYGIDTYQGANQDDASLIYSHTFLTDNGAGPQVRAQRPVSFNISNLRGAYRDNTRHKLHLHYTHGGLDSWFRYTRGGTTAVGRLPDHLTSPPESFLDAGFGYQQFSVLTQYKQEISDSLRLSYRFSYDKLDAEIKDFRNITPTQVRSYVESEYHARLMADQ